MEAKLRWKFPYEDLNEDMGPLIFAENRFLKRMFDIAFSLTFLLTAFPIALLIIGAAIKISSPGPVFFRQYRSGRNNRKFLCYKFRTMRINNAESKQATRGDSRVTRVGRILRATSMDELPQFINVLLGDMAIVGPRPMMLKHTEEFAEQVDRFNERHAITPGITGLAQVNGFRGEVTAENSIQKRVEIDRYYIRNWNPILDMKIIVSTVTNIMQGEENAY